jgi:branched-chain amino acid aminotransferase
MTTRVAIDGTVFPPEEARISVFDRGFLYGDSVFEVMRTYGGVPFALEDHLGRLQGSARRVAMALPVPIAQLRREVEATLAAAGNADAYVRIVVTRGSGELGLDPALARDPTRVIIVRELAEQPRELYVRGAAVATVVTQRATDATSAAGAKSSNYLANLLALRDAKQRGAYEAVVVTSDGAVLEGATSNVFLWRGGTLVTPDLSGGILAGITRQHVLDAARGLGLPAVERRVARDELWTADEVFVTSTLREVVPVVRVDDHEVGEGGPGAVTRRLHRAFRAMTPTPRAALPWE